MTVLTLLKNFDFRELTRQKIRRPCPCGSERAGRKQLREWFDTPLGQAMAAKESRELELVLPTMFGYHLLQIGSCYPAQYLNESLIKHKVIVDCIDGSSTIKVDAKMDSNFLGVTTDSVDVVVLSHVLELNADPHQVLREIDRILVPEGRVVILGFNPWGLWGLRSLLSSKRSRAPWCSHFFSPFRVKDWLQLLGYEMEEANTFHFKLPIDKPWCAENMKFLDTLGQRFWPAFGGGYMLVAKKRVTALTPVGPIWKRRRTMVRPGFVETRQ